MTKFRKLRSMLSICLSFMLIAAMAFSMTACSSENKTGSTSTSVVNTEDMCKLGQGEHRFYLTVKDEQGKEMQFQISTDKTTVGAALIELQVIEGEESQYGYYVKAVNGVKADYDTDGAYWAFYINGELANTGVDGTDITDDASYSFVYTKA